MKFRAGKKMHECKYCMDEKKKLCSVWIVYFNFNLNCGLGPSQPDEDDYGYVSQEASALYNKLMSKYNSLPAEKSIFAASGKKTIKDIASTKVQNKLLFLL